VILHELSYDAHPAFADLFEIRPWISAPAVAPICLSALYRGIGQIAHQTGARGYLRGDFGDQLFGASFSYLAHLWQEQRYETFLREVRRWQHLHGLAPLDLFYAHAVRPRLLERQKPHQQGHAPWVRPQLWHECERRLEEDEAYFRRVCPEPVVRRLFREMRGHKEFVSMQEELLATGLETREPYTDLRLVECILTYPPQDQMRPGVRKYLLREAMTGILPEPIRQRRDKGRIARIFFSGIARHQKELQELVHHAPDSITSYLDTVQLAEAVRRVALGDTADQVTLFSALALVLWVHRLPWGGGWLSAGQQRERNEKYMEKGGER
jgi:asparagine synthase (glutamine-hydrolysing)